MSDAIDDPLSALAPLLGVRPVLDDVCYFGGDWTAFHDVEGEGWAYFHIVSKGQCLLDRSGHDPLLLNAGDILLLPHGDAHITRARISTSRGRTQVHTEVRNAIRVKTTLGVEPDTELLCGRLHFEAAPESLIVSTLPDAIVIPAADALFEGRLRPLLEGIRDELDSDALGAAAIAANLAGALFVMILRTHLISSETSTSFISLLKQRNTARAVKAMLQDPARKWTLDELAAIAHTSRATLVRAFRAAVNLAPLAFLTEIRLSLARQRLKRGHDATALIAAEVGYQSEATFSRAIRRRFGVRPGALRSANQPKTCP